MPHIHTKPGQHDHTTSIYLFRTDFDQPKVMLHLHKKVGKFAQFGGHIELHETPWQSTIHELKEETGYDIEQVKILQPKTGMTTIGGAVIHPYPVVHATMGYSGSDAHYHTDTVYTLVTNEAPADAPSEGESTNIRLFTRNELIELGKTMIDQVTYDIALYIFDEILDNWAAIASNKFK